MEKEQGKRMDILSVMLDNGNKRADIACPEIGLIKFRYHLAWEIIVSSYPQDR